MLALGQHHVAQRGQQQRAQFIRLRGVGDDGKQALVFREVAHHAGQQGAGIKHAGLRGAIGDAILATGTGEKFLQPVLEFLEGLRRGGGVARGSRLRRAWQRRAGARCGFRRFLGERAR